MNLHELTAAQLRQAAKIQEKIEATQRELVSILEAESVDRRPRGTAATGLPTGEKLHWTQTPEGKARMAQIVRASWGKRRPS